ncbi:MAG: energy transducer TonB [Bacteroidota bacterium]
MKSLFKSSLFFGLFFLATTLSAQELAVTAIPTAAEFTAETNAVLYAPVSFPGGDQALLHQVQSFLEYPELAQNYGVEGMVVVRLSIDRDGQITDHTILRGLGFGCDEAAVLALKKLPNWQPALRNGQAVASIINVPLHFSLR